MNVSTFFLEFSDFDRNRTVTTSWSQLLTPEKWDFSIWIWNLAFLTIRRKTNLDEENFLTLGTIYDI